MSDEVVTVEQLRRWYVDTLRASVLATDPVRVTAWTGLAAEIRAALGIVGVVAPAQAPNPWRSVAADPPALDLVVLVAWHGYVESAFLDEESGQWCDTSASPFDQPPLWWMPIPAVPEAP